MLVPCPSGRPEEETAMAQPLEQQRPNVPPAKPNGWWKMETEPGESVDAIQAQFRAIFESAGSPRGAALFCNHVLLQSTTLFVTPQAVSIAEPLLASHGGVACADPTQGIFLVGNEADRDLLPLPELSTAPHEPKQQ
jgi:hypothetical protein